MKKVKGLVIMSDLKETWAIAKRSGFKDKADITKEMVE
jgi:hypothetical protein